MLVSADASCLETAVEEDKGDSCEGNSPRLHAHL